MAEINKEVLERLISSKLNAITAECNSTEFLAVVAASNADPQNKAFFVDSPSDLPDLNNAPLPRGSMVYVRSINTYLVAFNETWVSIDGRIYRNDGRVKTAWTWGCNSFGNLGDYSNVSKSSPVSVVGGFTDWCQVSAGRATSFGVRTNGTIWSWGYATTGQLGDGTMVSKSSPVSVVGGFTDWCQVSAGECHAVAVRSNGTAWAWGYNAFGRLGDGSSLAKSSPVSVVGGFTDWCQVSAGYAHTSAVRTNGTLWTWGFNGSGRLGDNTVVDRSSPVSVVGGFTDWCQVSAGNAHTAAVRTNGTIWAWGCNGTGRLGDNTTTNRSSPVSVVGGFTDWCQVSTGGVHTAAVRTNGTIWSWGANNAGQLGDNTIVSRSSPVSVVGGFTDWCQVSAGCGHSTAVRTNGTLWAWGCNNCGQLGDNTIVSKSSPVSVVGGFTDWCQVSVGAFHSIALRMC